jgi:arylsulfatase
MESGAGHFADMQPLSAPGPALYREDGRVVTSLPPDFYSSRFFADRLIEYLGGHDRDRPFFAYLAFTAPHFPLQAPDETLEKYRGRYDEGYEVLHARRVARLKALGFIPPDAEPFPPLPQEKPWSELSDEERRISARRMEIHAAMVDELDRAVGKVIDYLKANGLYENTVVFFMSDNGPEGHWLHQGLKPLEEWSRRFDNSYENMGRPGSYVMLGPSWARAITGPFRLFKGFTSEGGVRVPAFLHFPARLAGGRTVHQALNVTDVMPTLLELAGVDHPAPRFGGRDVLPMQGRSMVSLLEADGAVRDADIGWEFMGRRAYREGDWKVIWQPALPGWEPWPGGIRTETWQLYNLAQDPGELHDLSAEYPGIRDRLVRRWEAYARENGVILPDRLSGY